MASVPRLTSRTDRKASARTAIRNAFSKASCIDSSASTGTPSSISRAPNNLRYPDTWQGDFVDQYGSTRVADTYRWLEDLDSPEVGAWVAAQNAVTFAHLETLPHRDRLKQRLTELWDYPRTT